jgi:hypothetical protein
VRDHLPWLCQGDIFADAPVVDVSLTATGGVEATVMTGPAVLLTHDCDMDKPSRSGAPRVERMQFARLRSIEALPADRQRTLRDRRDKIAPYEALYLGEVSTFGESFILLSDPYHMPSAYFGLIFQDYVGHSEADQIGKYITAQEHDSRVGRLDLSQLALLRQKMTAFWARVVEDEPAPPAPQ